MNKVEVVIAGSSHTIVGDESKEYLVNLASFVNEEVEKFYNNENVPKEKSNILAALNIADQLLKSKKEITNLKKEIETLRADIQKKNLELRSKQSEIEQKEKSIADMESNKIVEDYKKKISDLTTEYEKRLKKKDETLDEAIKITEDTLEKFYNLQLRIAKYENISKPSLKERYKEDKNIDPKQIEIKLPEKEGGKEDNSLDKDCKSNDDEKPADNKQVDKKSSKNSAGSQGQKDEQK